MQVAEFRRGEFVISTDPTRLDLDVIYDFLTNCYWAKGIPREVVVRSIEHSLCFGIYDESGPKSPLLAKPARYGAPQVEGSQVEGSQVEGSQVEGSQVEGSQVRAPLVGFARVISDFATIAYLGDVFVLESHRGRGLSKWMMECILKHPSLQNLRRWILLTRDAHELYRKFGFTALKAPDRYMELHRPDVYEIRKTT